MHRWVALTVLVAILLQIAAGAPSNSPPKDNFKKGKSTSSTTTTVSTPVSSSVQNKANLTSTETATKGESKDGDDKNDMNPIPSWATKNQGMLKRGFYVLLVVTVIIAVYFGVRIYRTRNKKVKKYGLLSNGGGERIGLNPIDSDSEDDYTVFETKTLH